MRVVGRERQRVIGETLIALEQVTLEEIEEARVTGGALVLELSAEDWAALTKDGTKAPAVIAVCRIALVETQQNEPELAGDKKGAIEA